MNSDFAFISSGQLFVKRGTGEPLLLESKFAQEIQRRTEEIRKREEWKHTGPNAQFSCGAAMFCAGSECLPSAFITSLTKGMKGDELLYSLRSDDVVGLFSHSHAESSEKRLVHSNKMRVHHLDYSPTHELIACSIEHKDGTASIGIMNPGDTQPGQVTQGDAIDAAPSWRPGTEKRIVYQSAGLARADMGMIKAIGPFAIMHLSVDKGEVETLAESSSYDYILPKMDADGNLFCIRRPYGVAHRSNPLSIFTDILLLPYRIIRAIFSWFNIFSLMYTGKSLSTQGGERLKNQDLRSMLVSGNMSHALQGPAKGANQGKNTVPSSWKIICRTPQGSEKILLDGAQSFDINSTGEVIYSDGATVRKLTSTGKKEVLFEGTYVQHLIALS